MARPFTALLSVQSLYVSQKTLGELGQAVTFLICILDVIGSNLGRTTEYTNTSVGFLKPSLKIPLYLLKLSHDSFLQHPFQLITRYDPDTQHYVV